MIKLSDNLLIEEEDLNNELTDNGIVYQETSSLGFNLNGGEFNAITPNKNYLLSSLAHIEYIVTMENYRLDADDTGEVLKDFTYHNRLSMKGGSPFANAMTNINLSINDGERFELVNPNHFIQNLNLINVGKHNMNVFDSKYPLLNVGYSSIDYSSGAPNDLSQDDNLISNEKNLINRIYRHGEINSYDGVNITDFVVREAIIIPPFNHLHNIKDKLKSNSIFRRLSKNIPYVNKFNLRIKFNRLSPSIFEFIAGGYDSANVGGGVNKCNEIRISNISAKINLTWYKNHPKKSLKSYYDIPLWRNFIFSHNLISADNISYPLTDISISFMKKPKYFIIHAERSKYTDQYKTKSLISYDLNTGGAAATRISNLFNCSADAYLSIKNINFTTNSIKKLEDLSQDRLYEITRKNCTDDFFYDIEQFYGIEAFDYFDNTQFKYNWAKCFLVLTPSDIGLNDIDVDKDTDFQTKINGLATRHHSMVDADLAITSTYILYITLIYEDRVMRLSQNKSVIMKGIN